MKRLTDSLSNMVLSLTIITLFAAGALGGVYVLTEEPINQAKADKQLRAKTEVLPSTDNLVIADGETTDGVTIFRAYNGDEPIGAAVETFDKNGFSGLIRIMVGFDNEGVITGYSVLEQGETPGLGANMVNWFKTDKGKQNIIGLNPAEKKLQVSKDGGDVDAITAATITSRAFLRAVNKGYNAYLSQSTQAISGATKIENAEATDNVETAEIETTEQENLDNNE